MSSDPSPTVADVPPLPAGELPAVDRPIVLVGLMGAGKSSVGRRLARALGTPFTDSDDEIVEAARMSIPDIFATYGEPRFRELERRVICRLLDGTPRVVALGGGAFIDPETRGRVKDRSLSIWLRADLETLLCRTLRKRASRPLLMRGEPREVLAGLMEQRHPIYALADHVVDSEEQPPEIVVGRILQLLRDLSPARAPDPCPPSTK